MEEAPVVEEAPVALGAVWENVALRQWARVAASKERFGPVTLLLWQVMGRPGVHRTHR